MSSATSNAFFSVVAQPFEQLVDLRTGDLVGSQQLAGVQVVEPTLLLVVDGVGPLLLGDPPLLDQRFAGGQVFPVVVPLDKLDPAFGLRLREFDAFDLEQWVTLPDRLTDRDEHFLHQRDVEPGPNLGERRLVVVGLAGYLQVDRLGLGGDGPDLEPDRVPLDRRHLHQTVPRRAWLDHLGLGRGTRAGSMRTAPDDLLANRSQRGPDLVRRFSPSQRDVSRSPASKPPITRKPKTFKTRRPRRRDWGVRSGEVATSGAWSSGIVVGLLIKPSRTERIRHRRVRSGRVRIASHQ